MIDFNVERSLFLRDLSGKFTLEADTLTVRNENASYDFNFEGSEEAALLEIVMIRILEPFDPR